MDLSAWIGVIGVVVGILFAWFLDWRASQELKNEAAKLRAETDKVLDEARELRIEIAKVRRLVNLLAHALDTQGVIRANFDPAASDLIRAITYLTQHMIR